MTSNVNVLVTPELVQRMERGWSRALHTRIDRVPEAQRPMFGEWEMTAISCDGPGCETCAEVDRAAGI